MQRRLRAAAGVLAVLAVAALIAACGGSSGGPPAARLLSQTFGTNAGQIRSGELSLSVHASLPGLTAARSACNSADHSAFLVVSRRRSI